MLGGWGFRTVQIKRVAPLGPNMGQNKENFDKYSKIFFSCTTGRNVLIFGLECPWGKEIQICSNTVPRVMHDPTLGA